MNIGTDDNWQNLVSLYTDTIGAIRSIVGKPELPVIVTQTAGGADYASRQGEELFLPEAIDNVHLVDSTDLTRSDAFALDTQGQVDLGGEICTKTCANLTR